MEHRTTTPEHNTRVADPEFDKDLGDVALGVLIDRDLSGGTPSSSLADRIGNRTPEERAANLKSGLDLMLEEHRRDPTFFDDHRIRKQREQAARDEHGYRYRHWED